MKRYRQGHFLKLTILFFVFTANLFYGCKKDTKQSLDSVMPTKLVSSEMKTWLHLELNNSNLTIKDTSLIDKVQWQTAHEVRTDSIIYDIAIIPTVDTTRYVDPNRSLVTFLVLKKKNGEILTGNQFFLYGNSMKIKNFSDDYIKNYFSENINSDFTGIIGINELQGKFVESSNYHSGLRTTKKAMLSASQSSSKAVLSDKKKVNACTDWYYVYYDARGTVIDEQFLVTTCPGDNCAQESIISDKGVQSIRNLCNVGGGTNLQQNTSATTVTNRLTDDCLKQMVNAAISCDVQYNVDQSMNGIFGVNNKNNLIFQGGNITDASIDGYTDITDRSPALLYPGQSATVSDIVITLNQNTLPNASKEYIAATIIHESLHAFLDTHPGWTNQHPNMAQNYLTTMTQTLRSMFPTMSVDNAQALSWGGLERESPTLYNSLTQAERDNIVIANRNYKNGTLGHSCSGI